MAPRYDFLIGCLRVQQFSPRSNLKFGPRPIRGGTDDSLPCTPERAPVIANRAWRAVYDGEKVMLYRGEGRARSTSRRTNTTQPLLYNEVAFLKNSKACCALETCHVCLSFMVRTSR